jgi:small subunit ribosomal protein S18
MNMEEVKNSPSLDDVFDDSKVTSGNDNSDYGARKNRGGRRKKIVLNLNCPLCESGVKSVDYKDVYQLKKFTSVRGKIIHPEKSGACRKHQRQILRAIKRARYIALLPYVQVEG